MKNKQSVFNLLEVQCFAAFNTRECRRSQNFPKSSVAHRTGGVRMTVC